VKPKITLSGVLFKIVFEPMIQSVFTPFATNSKRRKYRFIEGFFRPAGGAEARLA
jgi:hypothetical protein